MINVIVSARIFPMTKSNLLLLIVLLFLSQAGIGMGRAQDTPAQASIPAIPIQPDDVLTWQNGQFHLGGKPFAEISFNKFDLLWAIHDSLIASEKKHDPSLLQKAVARQDSALRDLHSMGFRTIRIFGAPWGPFATTWSDPAARKQLFEAVDTTLDLCEKNQIQVVYSLGLGGFASGADSTQVSPLYADPNSDARQRCYGYIDAMVSRYKNRKAIAMWEVSNELTLAADIGVYKGKLQPSLPQVAAFLDATAQRIKQNDSLRLVSTGGSCLRASTWHRWHEKSWTLDTLDQYKESYAAFFEHSAIDVVDSHYYELKVGGVKLAPGPDGKDVMMTPASFMQIVLALGKAPIIGEYGTLPSGWVNEKTDPDWFQGYDDANAIEWVQKGLNELVDAKVPITYWWAYQSDRPVDQKANPVVFSLETTPDLVKRIAEANRLLKSRLGTQ